MFLVIYLHLNIIFLSKFVSQTVHYLKSSLVLKWISLEKHLCYLKISVGRH